MNIKVSIVILILLSFLNIGAITNKPSNIYSFGMLETNISSITEFKQNGVKLQYKTRDNIENESNRVKEVLINRIIGNCKEINKNEYEILNDNFHTNIKMWCEDNYTYVEIILINKNSKYTTMDLRNTLQKLENKQTENKQYFCYYEGKERDLNDTYTIDKLVSENNIQKTELLKINNGYTGTGYLSDEEKVNFALIKYNTGSHIIIGTPIIFETY